jgi:hypothetical protein
MIGWVYSIYSKTIDRLATLHPRHSARSAAAAIYDYASLNGAVWPAQPSPNGVASAASIHGRQIS